jgi:hypothetical protein
MKTKLTLVLTFLVIFGLSGLAYGQKAADYKITAIKVLPFSSSTGQFEPEWKDDVTRTFWNDLDISLLVLVEVSGKAGEYVAGRNVQVTITEGKKVKLTRTDSPGVLNDDGKHYIPVWVYPAMCDRVKITARVTGQKTASSMTKSLPFGCGE